MSHLKTALLSSVVLIALSTCALGQGTESLPSQKPTPAPTQLSVPLGTRLSFDQIVDRVVERERLFLEQMGQLHPLVETYIQNLKSDPEMGAVPVSDQYFFGRLGISDGTQDNSFLRQPGFPHRLLSGLSRIYDSRFLPEGFAQMVLLDDDFQRKYYDFTFVRREFLGGVRCVVIDVQPKKHAGNGRFIGRIWVEDQDYNIVRFNGTYTPHAFNSFYLHFDSWRLNLRPGIWLPAYVYSEESDPHAALYFKAQTRLWGYDQQHLVRKGEFAEILVDSPQTVRDQSDSAQDPSPLESQRLWERQAEDNATERMQKAGLMAPEGEVDKVLQTVVNNLEVTNNLEIQPEVRVRVLLTTPLESFTIGHTIVLSRGLLDVLPDEAALAMVISHELSHIALGHRLGTDLAFNDRLTFPDEKTFQNLEFTHSPADEDAADAKAVELLSHSPYKDQLSNAGLFLKALQARAPYLKNLIRAHVGTPLAKGTSVRMSALLGSAPQLEMRRADQITALPLGGRIKLDPWSNRIEMVKTKPVAPVSAREKMPFEVTPFFPYLTRASSNTPDKVALTAPVR